MALVKRGHIVADDVSWAAQTGKHLLRTQNVSEQNQGTFLHFSRPEAENVLKMFLNLYDILYIT